MQWAFYKARFSMFHYLFLGSGEISLTSDTNYPAQGGAFKLTCTIDMGEANWPVRIHRYTVVGNGHDCGQCTYPFHNGETGSCKYDTTATYSVQCTVEGTAITMVFDVTGVTNTEIGQWTCNPAHNFEPESDITITELGRNIMFRCQRCVIISL